VILLIFDRDFFSYSSANNPLQQNWTDCTCGSAICLRSIGIWILV